MAELTQMAFAELSGVTKGAITKALKNKKLVLTDDKKIDDKDPLSLRYLRVQLEKAKTGADRAIKESKRKPVIIEPVEEEDDLIDNLIDDIEPGIVEEVFKKPKTKTVIDSQAMADLYDDKESVEIEYKKANTEKVKISNAEKLKLLIPIDVVKKKFGQISSVILNYFFPIGSRLAPLVCSECGITDPLVIKKVENIIDKEVTRSLSEFKKVASEDLD